MPIVLASASPRRQELLKKAGINFEVKPANIPEIQREGESPRAFGKRMAIEKARSVGSRHGYNLVLGADTVVVVDRETLGKPQNAQDAARMLRLLSGRAHQVVTGVCLLGQDFEDVRSEETIVYFSALTAEEIEEYIATGEPMDKAGAYAIQGVASRWITKIEGDYSNVVGLPVQLVLRMLREHGAVGS
ncbi:MAG TPA: Maf family protein [Terriglobales bacterium]|jgi:septum formation protein